jgi:uncharacterized protein (UPF0548 family)
LDELGEVETLPTGLGLMVLTTLEGEKAKNEARSMIERSGSDRVMIDISLFCHSPEVKIEESNQKSLKRS